MTTRQSSQTVPALPLPPDCITTREAAAMLGITYKSVIRLMANKALQGIKHRVYRGRPEVWVVKKASVYRYMKKDVIAVVADPVDQERPRTKPIDFGRWYDNGGCLG